MPPKKKEESVKLHRGPPDRELQLWAIKKVLGPAAVYYDGLDDEAKAKLEDVVWNHENLKARSVYMEMWNEKPKVEKKEPKSKPKPEKDEPLKEPIAALPEMAQPEGKKAWTAENPPKGAIKNKNLVLKIDDALKVMGPPGKIADFIIELEKKK